MATCKECLHHDACLAILKSISPNIQEKEIEQARTSKNDCRRFKSASSVVEVVRCKDCKYAKPMSFKGYFMCKRHHKYCRKSDDFCSYGKRKGGAE